MKGNVSFEAMVQAIDKEKKSISIITYIQNSISPLLRDEEITWDCTKEGLQAVFLYFLSFILDWIFFQCNLSLLLFISESIS